MLCLLEAGGFTPGDEGVIRRGLGSRERPRPQTHPLLPAPGKGCGAELWGRDLELAQEQPGVGCGPP